MNMMANLGAASGGPAFAPISPRRELGAYEALWLEQGATFKSIADRFAKDPTALPSDFVSAAAAEQAAAETLKLMKERSVHASGSGSTMRATIRESCATHATRGDSYIQALGV